MTKENKQATTTKNIKVSNDYHTKVKVQAAKQGISIQKFIENLISKSI